MADLLIKLRTLASNYQAPDLKNTTTRRACPLTLNTPLSHPGSSITCLIPSLLGPSKDHFLATQKITRTNAVQPASANPAGPEERNCIRSFSTLYLRNSHICSQAGSASQPSTVQHFNHPLSALLLVYVPPRRPKGSLRLPAYSFQDEDVVVSLCQSQTKMRYSKVMSV